MKSGLVHDESPAESALRAPELPSGALQHGGVQGGERSGVGSDRRRRPPGCHRPRLQLLVRTLPNCSPRPRAAIGVGSRCCSTRAPRSTVGARRAGPRSWSPPAGVIWKRSICSCAARIRTPRMSPARPLSAAQPAGHHPIVELLLAKGADVNARATSGWTALMNAAWEGQTETVDLVPQPCGGDRGQSTNRERPRCCAPPAMVTRQRLGACSSAAPESTRRMREG